MDAQTLENMSSLFSVIGLGCALMMAHTIRYGAINRMAATFGMLLLPVVVAVVWRLGLNIGWLWTVALFIGFSMFASSMGTVYARKHGVPKLFALQPVLGAVALLSAMVAWLLRSTPAA